MLTPTGSGQPCVHAPETLVFGYIKIELMLCYITKHKGIVTDGITEMGDPRAEPISIQPNCCGGERGLSNSGRHEG